jgi:hypothetical protein
MRHAKPAVGRALCHKGTPITPVSTPCRGEAQGLSQHVSEIMLPVSAGRDLDMGQGKKGDCAIFRDKLSQR